VKFFLSVGCEVFVKIFYLSVVSSCLEILHHKTGKKHYHMMRFNADLGADYFKTWTQCKMERENNLKEYKMEEETPKFGAGSEFGREQREEARRKRYGINVKKYRSEDQPWLLSLGGKNGKKYKGIREGGVADNVSWYVFMQGKDGAFEAYPVDEWYNFQPIQRYKALSAEEAEEEFVRRDKIMNYFQVMYEKKFRKENAEPDEDEGKKKGPKKSGKKKKKEGGESDNSCEEESDEYNEGAEHDYISSDSSDSDQENEEIVAKELAGGSREKNCCE
ncbi:General transcription factor IIF subunit 1, partial [Armadillidium nasatum]